MVPQRKKVIKAINEMVCENCIYASLSQSILLTCHNPNGHDMKDFCSEGVWRVTIALSRPSTVPFEVAYDYLVGDEGV